MDTKKPVRRGSIAVMSVFLLVVMISMVAFAVNIGRMSNSIAQLQNANDAVGKSTAWRLLHSYGKMDQTTIATDAATMMSQKTMTQFGVDNTLMPNVDLQFGKYRWDESAQIFNLTWGATPANIVKVKLSRIDARNNSLDVELRKFLGRDTVELKTVSNVVFMPATGFLPPSVNQKLEILPFALDIDTWINLENGVGNDNFQVSSSNTVSNGGDGIKEVKIFPIGGNKNLPSGNRGTLRLGANNNSTSKLSRQIREGLNTDDMSYHPNGFSVANGSISISGDPGVSAAIEGDLNNILGQDRILPLFTSVNGNGANASYQIVKFVGVKVVKADLRGALNHKEVLLQPSTFQVEEAETNMKMPFNLMGTIFAKPKFIDD